MFIKQYEQNLKIDKDIYEKYKMNSIAYFDIETTGFDKENDIVMLISLGWYDDKFDFNIKQYYAEDAEDEKDVLETFKKDISSFSNWCSYNGMAFDEPFINIRMKKNNIKFKSPTNHIDLYRKIRPYHKQLGLERCNLKTVEKFIGIDREDKIDGGISVKLYEQYLLTKEENIKQILMLHNYEDVLSLPKIFNIVNQIESDTSIIREDHITEKQLKYLKFLMSKNKIQIDINVERISKKSASRIIDNILNGKISNNELKLIVEKSVFCE